MPAKLCDKTLAVSAMPWNHFRQEPPLPPEPKRETTPATPDETDQLRRKITELTVNAEKEARQAFEQGRQAGDAAAKKAMAAEVQSATQRLAQSICDLAALRRDVFHSAEADTVKLAIEIARRVLHRELSVNPSAIEGLVKAGLEKLHFQEIHRVRVHSDHEGVLRACLQETGRAQAVEIIADPSTLKGTVVFELARGSLDASVETQLREIERGLADELQLIRS